MKKITVISLVLLVLILYYFLAPIRWTLGFRQPRSYQDCVNAGGMVSKTKFNDDNVLRAISRCVYKDLHFEVLPGNI